jgi:hypothetical protein
VHPGRPPSDDLYIFAADDTTRRDEAVIEDCTREQRSTGVAPRITPEIFRSWKRA